MKQLNLFKIFNLLEELYGIITRIREDGNCEFTKVLNGEKRITPVHCILMNMKKLNENEWAKAINRSLTDFAQMAEQYNVVIRRWDNVKFGHWQLVKCIKEFIPEDKRIDTIMGHNYIIKEKHLIVGETYRVIEAFYNNQVYVINESGVKFFYHEDHFEEIK